MQQQFNGYEVRDWQPGDRQAAADLIRDVLAEYGLGWEPIGADYDVLEVERCYQDVGGEFWVVMQGDRLVGTAAYYPIQRGDRAVEIREMYLLPEARGRGLGRWLLQQLETAAADHGFYMAWIETGTVLQAAVQLYETSGYQPATGVETQRCDRVYCKVLAQVAAPPSPGG
ncbi:MAG: GNAT family N-acetyltransferase [Oscillatoriales cyanobacterium]|nr:MAG: GNAT family N-acetyltransferase [Oscillatoriales cyanobacterium]